MLTFIVYSYSIICVWCVHVRKLYIVLLLRAAIMRVNIAKSKPTEQAIITDMLIIVLAGSSYSIQSHVGVQLRLPGRQ